VKGVPQFGRRVGNWLTAAEGEKLLSGFDHLSLGGNDLAVARLWSAAL
jgi:hypothetical protein